MFYECSDNPLVDWYIPRMIFPPSLTLSGIFLRTCQATFDRIDIKELIFIRYIIMILTKFSLSLFYYCHDFCITSLRKYNVVFASDLMGVNLPLADSSFTYCLLHPRISAASTEFTTCRLITANRSFASSGISTPQAYNSSFEIVS